MLRATYFAQELLSTFNTVLGEVALQPSTGGTFIVELYYSPQSPSASNDSSIQVQRHVLWDRKAEGGFPETKELKRRIRDVIEPGRDLGHVDGKKSTTTAPPTDISYLPPASSPGSGASSQHRPAATPPVGNDLPTDSVLAGVPTPKAINRLVGSGVGDGEGEGGERGERKFTPMDVSADEGEGEDQQLRNTDESVCEDCN